MSEGVVCDLMMVGWLGGGVGMVVLLLRDYAVGVRASKTRSRLDGKMMDEGV